MTTSSASTVAEVYARSLVLEGHGAADVSQVGSVDPLAVLELSRQVSEVVQSVTGSSELRATLADKSLGLDIRIGVVDELFKGFDARLLAMLHLMIERFELKLLARVESRFIDLLEESYKITLFDVTTAIELDDVLRKSIKDKYSAQFGTQILLRETVDPRIKGGIIMQAQGKRIDASLVSQLAQTRHVLASRTSGGRN